MTEKEDIVGGNARLTLSGENLLHALAIRQAKERKAGRVVSLVEAIREIVEKEYTELMETEVVI